MRNPGDSCDKCGAWTTQGKKALAENSKKHPIYGTDFNKPLSTTVEELRNQLIHIRGKLHDISSAYPGWGEWLTAPEGGLTLVISYLHDVKERMIPFDIKKEG